MGVNVGILSRCGGKARRLCVGFAILSCGVGGTEEIDYGSHGFSRIRQDRPHGIIRENPCYYPSESLHVAKIFRNANHESAKVRKHETGTHEAYFVLS